MVAWSGVVPDIDALAGLGGAAAYSQYHHVLGHSLVAAILGTAVWTVLARQGLRVLALPLLAFHLHLLCDLVGSGRDWSIVCFYPFSRYEHLSPYGWDLASPQNAVVWLLAVAAIVWIGVRRSRTVAETFLPAKTDGAVVATLRKVFRRRGSAGAPNNRVPLNAAKVKSREGQT